MIRSAAAPVRVLLVEDDPADARLIRELLEEGDAAAFDLERVDRLEGMEERVGRAGADPVDVILLDLDLPGSRGLETFERAQRMAPDHPIVVITGLDDEKVALEVIRAGAQDYLAKGGLEGELLVRVVRYAIERKHCQRPREEAAEWIRRLSMAVDQGPAAAIITDRSGTIEYVNARFTEVTGYAPEEAIGRDPRMLQSGETPAHVYRDLWRTILSGHRWQGEILNRRKDGTLFWDAVQISPIRNAEGEITHFLALQQDVTERRATLQALRERDEQFRQVTEAINEVYFLVSADFSDMVYVSPAYETVWGRVRQGLYDEPDSFLDAVVEEDLPELLDYIEQVRRGGSGKHEYRIRRPDGELRWILMEIGAVRDVDGRVYRLGGVALDITARKEAEDALRASERRLRTLFETVNLIVLALDTEGTIEYVNPFLLELTGYREEEVVGRDWLDLAVPAGDRARMEDIFVELLEGEAHAHYESAIVTSSGQERMIRWHNTVLRDAENRTIGTLSIGEDVTERARLEEQLHHSQKMEAVGRLAGGVAHDFNNLLTAILGPSELLLLNLDPGDPARADLEEIRSAAMRAADLTRQLLAFSRKQVLEPRVVDLNALVSDFDRLLRRVIGEDVRLRTVLDPELGSVRADPGQLEQVIMNLAVNARDAMPTGGMLTVETSNVELDDSYAEGHVQVEPGRYVLLAVTDTGTGMDEATRARIFEPFFTTKGKGEGTGLGLSTVCGIVQQSGGYVWAYAEPDAGATFKVYLPRVDDPAEARIRERVEPGSVTGTETVLMVEDDDLVGSATRRMLEARGYRVLPAASGREALEIARGHQGPLPLLLTDVVMPGMSGPELAERILELHPEIGVIYVSGYTDETIVRHGLLEPGVHFLQKPFTPDGLAQKVRQVLDTR